MFLFLRPSFRSRVVCCYSPVFKFISRGFCIFALLYPHAFFLSFAPSLLPRKIPCLALCFFARFSSVHLSIPALRTATPRLATSPSAPSPRVTASPHPSLVHQLSVMSTC